MGEQTFASTRTSTLQSSASCRLSRISVFTWASSSCTWRFQSASAALLQTMLAAVQKAYLVRTGILRLKALVCVADGRLALCHVTLGPSASMPLSSRVRGICDHVKLLHVDEGMTLGANCRSRTISPVYLCELLSPSPTVRGA